MSWLVHNQVLVTLLSALVIAALTVLLLILNAIYVHANWRMMRVVETDLRFRTKPIPNLTLVQTVDRDVGYRYDLDVKTDNAPLRFISLELSFRLNEVDNPDHKHVHKDFLQVQNRVLRSSATYHHSGMFYPTAPVEYWCALLQYSDLAGVSAYEAKFDSWDTYLTTEIALPVPGPPSRWTRLKELFKRHETPRAV